MRILSLETATYQGGIAYADGQQTSTRGPFEPRSASREILPAVDALLKETACPREKVELVAVSTGPGLFTGVRVGLAIAKGFCWALANGTPEGRSPLLIGVSTLEAIAHTGLKADLEPGDRLAAIADARRGEVYAAFFEINTQRALKRITPDIVVRPETMGKRLASLIRPPAENRPYYILGDGADRYEAELRADEGIRDRIQDLTNLPLAVARLGERQWQGSGEGAKPEALSPCYVRRPDARKPAVPLHQGSVSSSS